MQVGCRLEMLSQLCPFCYLGIGEFLESPGDPGKSISVVFLRSRHDLTRKRPHSQNSATLHDAGGHVTSRSREVVKCNWWQSFHRLNTVELNLESKDNSNIKCWNINGCVCLWLLYIALLSANSSLYFIKIFVDLTFYAHICTKLVGLAWSLKKYIQVLYGVCST